MIGDIAQVIYRQERTLRVLVFRIGSILRLRVRLLGLITTLARSRLCKYTAFKPGN